MKGFLPLLALIPLLSACNPQQEKVTLGAPASKALKTTELANDGDQRLKLLASQTDLTKNALFTGYRQRAPSQWSTGWTRRIDFTGVSWSQRQAGTAITPRHIVVAAHYPIKAGKSITFHDRSGVAHTRKLTERVSLRAKRADGDRHDITVILLDKPLPPSIKSYRLLPPRTDYEHALPGCPVLVTEQDRRVFLHQVRRVATRSISFQKNPNFSDSLYKSLIKGDSGNPSFLLVGGEPILIETHTGGGPGSGPFYSDPAVFKALQEAVAKLDPSYRIRTVPLDPQLAPAPPKKEEPQLKNPRVRRVTPPNSNPTPTPNSQGNESNGRTPRVRRVPVPPQSDQ